MEEIGFVLHPTHWRVAGECVECGRTRLNFRLDFDEAYHPNMLRSICVFGSFFFSSSSFHVWSLPQFGVLGALALDAISESSFAAGGNHNNYKQHFDEQTLLFRVQNSFWCCWWRAFWWIDFVPNRAFPSIVATALPFSVQSSRRISRRSK